MFTPGPWHVSPFGADECEPKVLTSAGVCVALTINKDDARLIAALPDMRHAVDMIEGALMGWDDLLDTPENCALDETDDDAIELEIKVTWGQLRRVLAALAQCTGIINSSALTTGQD